MAKAIIQHQYQQGGLDLEEHKTVCLCRAFPESRWCASCGNRTHRPGSDRASFPHCGVLGKHRLRILFWSDLLGTGPKTAETGKLCY